MNYENNSSKRFIFYVLLLFIIFGIWFLFNQDSSSDYSFAGLKSDLKKGEVVSVTVSQNTEVPTGAVTVNMKDGTKGVFYTPDVSEVISYLDEQNFSDYTVTDVPQTSWLDYLIPILGIVLVCVFVFMMMRGPVGGGGNNRMMDFGKSRAKMTTKENIDKGFDDVAGLIEEKDELVEVVDFLKDPGKYTTVGARIPKGILLEGHPGTGKTLLAKAVAGEAHVPFFSISGSDFVEMFVGVGAARVRDLFSEAKKHSPCIVFIDEIDAVARRRGTGMGGGHDEREQTLNQILVEMDGFGVNEGVIVMAATNRVDILDPAILRPGRFDRKIYVGAPDVRGREEILRVHARNKPLAEDVDLKQVAQSTAGFVGADLENLLNEAAIHAAGQNRMYITMEDIRKSFIKVGIGAEKKSRVLTEKDKRITAYHEAGHAILFHELPELDPVYTISIIPTGEGAAGYTMPIKEKDDLHVTKNWMLQEIQSFLGGRIAEELIFDDITAGASNDIMRATKMARNMVTKYGMSEKVGLLSYSDEEDEVFIGRDMGKVRPYGEDVATLIDQETKRIVDDCYKAATKIIKDNIDLLHKTAELLLEKERISRDEFEALIDGESPEPVTE